MARVLYLLGCFICVPIATAVTPVEKVIQLLEDLKTEVETAGSTEAGTYDTFACFCKTTTDTKSTAITTLNTDIDAKAAKLEEDETSKVEKEDELTERKVKQEELGKELEEATARCLKEALEFEAEIADLTKALNSLDKALTALKAAKFLQVKPVLARQVKESLQLADALGLTKSQKDATSAWAAFLQVDPDDPTYKFRSDGIISTLTDMQTMFTDKKTETEGDRDKAKTACDTLKGGLTTEMGTNSNAMGTLKTDIGTLETDIAAAKEFLIEKSDELKDEQRYMKDLTERCELRARDWDQRSKARGDEITALTEALAILKDGKDGGKSIQELDAVNNRSFVQEPPRLPAATIKPASSLARHVAPTLAKVPSFLQARSLRGRGRSATEVQRDHVVDLLQQEGTRIHSQMLATLSSQIATSSNPFGRVKQLIQELIQRLLDEAAQEATKKGFCDTEIGKAETERDFRFAEITKLTAVVNALEARRKELKQEIEDLNVTIPALHEALDNATTQRGEEHEQNVADIKTAKEGVEAVAEAITILKVFYKKAGKAKVSLLQSPVDEDTDGPGFSGAYRGKQDAGTNIIGILEVIHSDFDRTARHTEQAEKEAQAAFVKLERASKVDIAEKERTVELDVMELESVKDKLAAKMDDLKSAQKMLDDALKAMEDLKPMCVDTGMTFAERKQKREDEIAALKKAICFIDPEGAEPSCGR